MFLIALCSEPVFADTDLNWFDTEKTKLTIASNFVTTESSSYSSYSASWEIGWKNAGQIRGLAVSYSSRPYVRYSKNVLETERETVKSYGAELIRVRLNEFERIKPYLAFGLEQKNTTTSYLVNNDAHTVKDLYTYSAGVELVLDSLQITSFTIFSIYKSENTEISSTETRQYGSLLGVDLLKLYQSLDK